MSSVQLVTMRGAALCTFIMFVVNALDDHIVDAYSCIGLTTALYVASIVSLCLLHSVEEKALVWYSFGCIGCYVVNMFVVMIEGETQYIGTYVHV